MPAYSGSFYQSGKAIRLGKTRVEKMNWWRVRVESNRPATNFPGVSVD